MSDYIEQYHVLMLCYKYDNISDVEKAFKELKNMGIIGNEVNLYKVMEEISFTATKVKEILNQKKQ